MSSGESCATPRAAARTPQHQLNSGPPSRHVTPAGFHWSIEHMAVMCPADIDESQQMNQSCPFEDGPDSEIQRTINKYWDEVHDACSPGMRPLVDRSSTDCAQTDASHVHSVVTEDNTANIDSSNSSNVAKNNRYGNKYLESLAKNCVTPNLFRKWKAVEDCRTPSLPSRTPKRRVNMALKSRPDPDTPKCALGFGKHFNGTSPFGSEGTPGSNLMGPFEDDEPDSKIPKSSRFKDFWDDVTDAFSPIVDPTMRKSPPVSRVRSLNTEDSTPKTSKITFSLSESSDLVLKTDLPKTPSQAPIGILQMFPNSSMQAGCSECQMKKLYPILFKWPDSSAQSVFVTGSFLNWESKIALFKEPKDAGWSVEVKLPRGHYEYKFIVDERWAVDHKRQPTIRDKEGDWNNVVHV